MRYGNSVAAALVLAGMAESASGQERKIACSLLPPGLLASFEKAYPKAVIEECGKEVDDGKTIFEIASKEGEIGRDVQFKANGTVVLVKETVPIESVPEAVMQAVQKRYPQGVIALAEKIMAADAVQYEFSVRNRGKVVEIVFEENGEEAKQ